MIGELIEKLSISNAKLFKLFDIKADMASRPADFTKAQMADAMRRDIELCKQRGFLKRSIDKAINDAIIKGGVTITDEVKSYGS